jgi:hypothetical protein
MLGLKLWTLTLLLGLLAGLPGLYGLLKPDALRALARRFPRHIPTGVFLMVLATIWFIYNVSQESLSDFARLKEVFYLLFAGVGLGTCIFVHDFLAVRGLAVVVLLLAKWMVDAARWVDTEWRLVVVVWAYALVLGGMWLTISPWRLRDWLDWGTATEGRLRALSWARVGFALGIIGLALLVYRPVEARALAASWSRLCFGAG